MSIRILTDSAATVSSQDAAEWNIEILPMSIFFDGVVFLDGVNLSKDEFYKRLLEEEKWPSTSQPTTQDYANAYKKLQAEGAKEIIYIHMSKNFSHMFESASQAIELSGVRIPVTIYNSNTLSSAMGLIVLAAAKMAKCGVGHDEIIKRLDEIRENTYAFMLFDNVKHLAKSGRADKTQNFLGMGSLLNTKHILSIKNGEIVPAFQVRSYAKGIKRLLDIVRETALIEEVAISYTTNPQDAEILEELLLEFLPAGKIHTNQASPILGTHSGRNALDMAYRTH
jgi:DegV family protein with EDD domain